MKPATNSERLAVWLSRDFVDGERIYLGSNVTVGRAAMLFANITHAPSLRIMLALTGTSVSDKDLRLYPDNTDFRAGKWPEFHMTVDTMLQDYRYYSNAFAVDGIQVDPYGNSNLIGLGEDHSKLKLRGPGAIGSLCATTFTDRFYIISPTHSPRKFVERCDYVSCPGWIDGTPDARTRAGIPGGGPRYCLTPFGVFDYPAEGGYRMRLLRLQPGVEERAAREATGFELESAPDLSELPDPTPDELALLRRRVDPDGLLAQPGGMNA